MKTARLLILLLAAVPLSQAAPTWTTIDYPGATSTYVMGVNTAGEMVGYYSVGSQTHGFLWSAGTFTTIDYPAALDTYVKGINDSGQIVGFYYRATDHAFLLDGSTFTLIDFPGAYSSHASSINNAGDVVGYYGNPFRVGQGFKLSGEVFTTINAPGRGHTAVEAINNLGIVTGPVCSPTDSCPTEGGKVGFAYDGTSFLKVVYPGAILTVPNGLNDRNEIVGYATVDPAEKIYFGFLRARGRYILLNYPGAGRTWATGIDNNENIVGYYYGKDGYYHGFLRTR